MDPVSVFVVVTLMMLLNGAILGFVHRDLPPEMRASADDWRISTLLIAGGCVVLAAQAYGSPALMLPIANGLLMFGLAGYWRALRRFDGRPAPRWLAVPPLLGTLGIYVFAAHVPNLVVRVVISAIVWIICLLGAAASLRAGATHERASSRRVLVTIFAVLSLFMAARGLYFVVAVDPHATVLDRGNLMNAVTPVLAAVMPVVGTTAYLHLCSERIRRQWERAASTDYLTGLANRRTLGTEGGERLTRARVHGDHLAIAVVDIDHFKAINDTHGHDVGDVALRHVATRLQSVCRGKDLPARMGGEEFVILFDRIEPAQAQQAGERMRRAVESEPFRAGEICQVITVSIGVAALRPDDKTFDDLLRRADQALYAAKTGGRNRVELAA